MREFTIEQIKAICDAAPLRIPGAHWINQRLDEYQEKYKGGYSYYAAFHEIVKFLAPDLIVEIGSWQGTSAAAFASGDHLATVVTIDHLSDPGDDLNLAKVDEACRVFDNLNFVQGCSTEMVTAQKPGTRCVFPILNDEFFSKGRKIDILFIDGWHGGEYARADYDTYAPFLSDNALVICDDICGGNSAAIFGMQAFWDGLPGVERYLDGRIHSGYPMGFLKHSPEAYKAVGYADVAKAPDYEIGN